MRSLYETYVHGSISAVLGPFRRYLPAVVLLGLLATALEGIGIGLVIPLLDVVVSGDSNAQGFLPGLLVSFGETVPRETRGLLIGGAILALLSVKNIVVYANGLLQAWIYGQAGHRLRTALAQKLTAMDASDLLSEPPSRMLNIISNESWRSADAVAAVMGIMVNATAALILLAFLMAMSWQLTLVVLLGITVIQYAHERMSQHFAGLSTIITDQNRGLAGRMLHLVAAWRLIRLFGREGFEKERFAQASDSVRLAALDLQKRQMAVAPITEIAHATLFMAVIFFAWSLGITFGTAAAFIILLYRLQPQVRQIQARLAALRGWTGSLDEVQWLMTAAPAGSTPSGDLPAPALTQGLAFESVSFHYAGAASDRPALHDATFEVPAGTSLAIIGRSGSGKSTMAHLLCRLLEPTSGQIVVDGIPLSEIDGADWLAHMAVASQELELFDGSVTDNIRYGAPEAGEDRVLEAARQADADEFIRTLPKGYDTGVGDRGLSLSAGQRQRIALARALVREPRLLIMDEATNAMDLLSERAALRILEHRRGKGTTLVISHHLSSIKRCDRFIRLDRGRIVESGTTQDFNEEQLARMLRTTRA
ncbi:ABC transporter ATP-binding protein [Tropicimonas aquimaris]|uniref:ABC transporter ATP-binding protein n=1 Tax=Tropicimonas aquimaris TaxID=914152 RepID=A0ABW3IU84_9RHOB